mmetsp:Transcript_33631/g.70714  ORF Transcript_33631/g.70714 Transcript_33631/m.70714 type:complete len:1009 (+) Transcript_33631:162-3188(+)
MDGASGEVVRRLASSSSSLSSSSSGGGGSNSGGSGADAAKGRELDAILDRATGRVGYDLSRLLRELNLKDGGGGSYDPLPPSSESSERHAHGAKRYALLRRMHAVLRASYADEYLTFVRSIFLALDRSHVYLADCNLEEIGHGTAAAVGGKVVERSAASSGYATNDGRSRVWGLWEVGVACLRKHMLHGVPATVGGAASAGVMGETDATTLPVLTTMVLATAYAILAEYDDPSSSSSVSDNVVAMSDVRPLLRNCVRTIVDLGALPSLLEEIIVAATARFEREGRWWGMALAGDAEGGDSAGAAGGRRSRTNGPDFLRHVEDRLRQSGGMAGYYLPGNAASGAALRRLAKRPCLPGAVPPSSAPEGSAAEKELTWSPANCTTRRILPAIIERELLAPHLVPTPGGILEPRHLHPMLDDDDGGGTHANEAAWKGRANEGKTYQHAKRLYGLCWRMTMSTSPRSEAPDSPSQTTPASAFQRWSNLDHLRIAFGQYGRLRGLEIVKQGQNLSSASSSGNNKEMEKKVIPDLLAFKNHLYALHAVAFRSDESFGAMVRSILEDVLNGAASNDGDGGRRIAELLAKHVDARFKDAKAQATASSNHAAAAGGAASSASRTSLSAAAAVDPNERFQNEILALFRHVHSKDVFEAFYKRDLAKRLLTGRAVSTDMERSFLSKLKAECGAGYTSKMEGMFKDMELSRDIMGSYSAYASSSAAMASAAALAPAGGKMVDMDVQVLTTGYWPVYPKYPNIILPPELLTLRSKFETYYNDKYQGRRIAWQYSLGNCIVKATFPKSPAPKELIVNVCQSLVLLCFKHEDGNEGRGLTLEDIKKRTGIDDRSEMERVLQSLSMGRDGTRVLRKVDYDSPTTKTPPSPSKASSTDSSPSPRKIKRQKIRRTVGPFDRFLFNSSFSSNQRRIRITNITMKETSEERTKTHEAVSKDRLYFIDAAVVRIMKARKTIDHRGLMGEVMAQLKFPAQSSDIKKRIESLIEREYMERVDGDVSKYKYLA